MSTLLRVLSEDQRAQVHERTLSILSSTGVQVDTARGRAILGEAWEAAGRPTTLGEAREKVGQILANHQTLPLDEDVERELDRIQQRALAE